MSQKPKHPDKHQITKGLPKEFREIADSAIDHIGNMLDNMTLKDIIETLPLATCAYLGYRAFQEDLDPELKLIGASIGVLGYKLATTDGLASQTVGLAILAGLGLTDPNAARDIAIERKRILTLPKSEDRIAAYIELMNKYQHPNE